MSESKGIDDSNINDSKVSIDKSHYVRNTAETVISVYENTKNLTTVGKKVFETAEAIVGSTGLKVSTLDAAIDTIDDQINYYTGSFDVNKKLSDYQTYFLGQLSTEYYQKVWSTLGQLKKSIVNTQAMLSEKAPDNLSTNEMKKNFDQAIKQAVEKSNSLISAVLEIPGQDAFKSLPIPIMNAVQYIKSTPEMFKNDSDKLNDPQQIQGLLDKMTSLVDSVTNIFGLYMSPSIIGVNNTSTTTTTTLTPTSSTQIISKKFQDFKGYFTNNLSEDYYQKVGLSLGQLQDSIVAVRNAIKDKAPSSEDLKKLLDKAISKSNDLITTVLAIPGNDVFKSLPSSTSVTVEYIKSFPGMIQNDDNVQILGTEQIKLILDKLTLLGESVKEVFGNFLVENAFNPTTVIKILQDFKNNCTELPQEYYQQIHDSLLLVEKSLNNMQADFKEKTLTEEELKKLFDQTIKKSKELIDAVLHVPGQDLIIDGVEHIKSIPSTFKTDIQKIKNVDNAKELIEKISNLVKSISTVYGPEPEEVTEDGRLC